MLEREAYSWELDHLLIWVAPEAPESSVLSDIGLRHTGIAWPLLGRGTAAVVYMFENAYLALAWVDNPALAGLHSSNPCLDVLSRADWWRSAASPFGVGLRPRAGSSPPFPVPAAEHPRHLVPGDASLWVAEQSRDRRHPLYYGTSPSLMGQGEGEQGAMFGQFVKHPMNARRLTAASLTVDAADVGEAGQWLARCGVLSVEAGESPSLELILDSGQQGLYSDLRPTLPLKVRA